MIKIVAALAFAALASAAHAQQAIVYDSSGRVVSRSVTGSDGTRTVYSADGKTLTRESTDSGGTKTIFDAKTGKIIGRETPQR